MKAGPLKCEVIIVDNCAACRHRDHKGAFAEVSYIPCCTKMGTEENGYKAKELPYRATTYRNMVVAEQTVAFPDWCPLEDYNE